ncbi:hypothetical protein TREES_T100010989 [Tupaia chinensis]|uniref:Uncharacterized protein n=1 Tax=Tupaia chinensis TaxID=246437 RepID=L9JIJ2_TUPCH|nr:hypothetical protein TREES_T100010989 [Tupaia chinensis]
MITVESPTGGTHLPYTFLRCKRGFVHYDSNGKEEDELDCIGILPHAGYKPDTDGTVGRAVDPDGKGVTVW